VRLESAFSPPHLSAISGSLSTLSLSLSLSPLSSLRAHPLLTAPVLLLPPPPNPVRREARTVAPPATRRCVPASGRESRSKRTKKRRAQTDASPMITAGNITSDCDAPREGERERERERETRFADSMEIRDPLGLALIVKSYRAISFFPAT
jgi:hypothetical protein